MATTSATGPRMAQTRIGSSVVQALPVTKVFSPFPAVARISSPLRMRNPFKVSYSEMSRGSCIFIASVIIRWT